VTVAVMAAMTVETVETVETTMILAMIRRKWGIQKTAHRTTSRMHAIRKP
jgi:hypothetical protein